MAHINTLPATPYILVEFQIEHYSKLLQDARKKDDIPRRAWIRAQLHNFKQYRKSLLN